MFIKLLSPSFLFIIAININKGEKCSLRCIDIQNFTLKPQIILLFYNNWFFAIRNFLIAKYKTIRRLNRLKLSKIVYVWILEMISLGTFEAIDFSLPIRRSRAKPSLVVGFYFVSNTLGTCHGGAWRRANCLATSCALPEGSFCKS